MVPVKKQINAQGWSVIKSGLPVECPNFWSNLKGSLLYISSIGCFKCKDDFSPLNSIWVHVRQVDFELPAFLSQSDARIWLKLQNWTPATNQKLAFAQKFKIYTSNMFSKAIKQRRVIFNVFIFCWFYHWRIYNFVIQPNLM